MEFKPQFENNGWKYLPENLRNFDVFVLKLSDYMVSFTEFREGFFAKFLLVVYIVVFPLFQVWGLYSNIRYDSIKLIGVIMFVLSVASVGWILNALVKNSESDLAYIYLEGKSKLYMHITFGGLGLMALNQIWRGVFSVVILFLLVLLCYVIPFLCRYAIAVMYDQLEGHPDTTFDPDREEDVWDEGWGRGELEYEDDEEEGSTVEIGSDKAWNQEVRYNMEQTQIERMMQGRRK